MKDLFFYLESGGWVVPPLAFATLVLWYALGYRYAVLKRAGHRHSVREKLNQYLSGQWSEPRSMIEEAVVKSVALHHKGYAPLRPYLDDTCWQYVREIGRYNVLIRTIVMTAPLVGLLGTVVGMIETFDSLQTMSLFSQSGGIAGGISQALITTQLGLAVAIPGLFISSFLEKRQRNIEMELAQLKDILCAVPKGQLPHPGAK